MSRPTARSATSASAGQATRRFSPRPPATSTTAKNPAEVPQRRHGGPARRWRHPSRRSRPDPNNRRSAAGLLRKHRVGRRDLRRAVDALCTTATVMCSRKPWPRWPSGTTCPVHQRGADRAAAQGMGGTGFTFGDWLQPVGGKWPSQKPFPTIGDDASATIYHYISSGLTANAAGVVGNATIRGGCEARAEETGRHSP